MAITERDFIRIFARHGVNKKEAKWAFKIYFEKRNSIRQKTGEYGIDDESAKIDIDYLAALAAGEEWAVRLYSQNN